MWNIPVGAEKDSFCQDIVSNILRQHINLEGDLEAMRAQSSNKHKAKYNWKWYFTANEYLSRYTDKQYILRRAASALKDNSLLEANRYISDDVKKEVRDDRKKLRDRHCCT